MANGRKTGGRKAGTPNRVTAERERMIAASGLTPLECMLQNMRRFHAEAEAAEQELTPALLENLAPQEQFNQMLAAVKKTLNLRQAAQQCAKDAAPYCHPRLNDRPINFPLPKVESTADAVKVSAAILEAVSRGELTPKEAAELGRLVESFARALEASDLERRIAALERASSAIGR